MDENLIINIKKQHLDNYKKSLIDIIENNTNALVNDDIASLIKKPPLDSMDLLKVKLLELAKKYKIILNTSELDKLLDNYRDEILSCCSKISKKRICELSTFVNNKELKENDVIVLYKKDFINMNKSIRKKVKEKLLSSLEKNISVKTNSIFKEDVNDDIKNNVINDYLKYVKKSYQKQFMENFDIKVLVKDTTLINSFKEQTDRYLFTLNNSRLLKEVE